MKYKHKQFVKDTDTIIEHIEKTKSKGKIRLIAPMFGALPLATRMRNLKGYDVSLVKMSRYADNDDKATWVYNDGVSVDEELIICEDLYDKGETLAQVMDLVRKSYPNNVVRAVSLFGRSTAPSWLWYVNEAPTEEWIIFETWER